MTTADPAGLLAKYDPDGFFCEMFGDGPGPARGREALVERLDRFTVKDLKRRAQYAERELYNLGITFTVYTEKDQIDRILPFDVIPRVLSAREWETVERGVVQRVAALNALIWDVYHDQRIIKDGIIPAELILGSKHYRPEMQGLDVPFRNYCHVAGIDLVRDDEGVFRVLEDNARAPSGVSYVVENRHLMQRAFPDLMRNAAVRPVSNYGQRLGEALAEMAPPEVSDPQVVLLTPGVYNSAYFEHIFLAREMGVPLVEGRDLVVEDDRVYMRTIGGLSPVHVIYRRINDEFLDPEVFHPESVLGAKGLMRAYRKGTVAIANGVGTGFADDKAVYAYLPRAIRYYLDEDAILPNVDTHLCRETEGLRYTLDHLSELVVKPVGESGGYGITIGPRASKSELKTCRDQLRADPANYISQPMVRLSVCPTLVGRGVEPRHVDLRPFAVTGRETWVLPGGLSRVALKRGSMIVNSSQGGGSKDTWVLG